MSRLSVRVLPLMLVAVISTPTEGHDPVPRRPWVQGEADHSAECACRALGRMFSVGETACLATAEGPRLAECGMVLNNTSWRFTQRPCPES